MLHQKVNITLSTDFLLRLHHIFFIDLVLCNHNLLISWYFEPSQPQTVTMYNDFVLGL